MAIQVRDRQCIKHNYFSNLFPSNFGYVWAHCALWKIIANFFYPVLFLLKQSYTHLAHLICLWLFVFMTMESIILKINGQQCIYCLCHLTHYTDSMMVWGSDCFCSSLLNCTSGRQLEESCRQVLIRRSMRTQFPLASLAKKQKPQLFFFFN